MCGICGVVQVGGDPRQVIGSERLDWMTDLMTHRGPDDRGTFSEAGVAFGVRDLSIVEWSQDISRGRTRRGTCGRS